MAVGAIKMWAWACVAALMVVFSIQTVEIDSRFFRPESKAVVAELSHQHAPEVGGRLRRRRLSTLASADFSKKEKVWFLRSVSAAQGGGWASSPHGSSSTSWVCPHDNQTLADPMVVVGTDGSGTRVVAKLLALLPGVTVLVERGVYGQMDVDGRVAQVHFTDTIQDVLSAAGSPNYDLPPLPLPPFAPTTAGADKHHQQPRHSSGTNSTAPLTALSFSAAPKPSPLVSLLPGSAAAEARTMMRTFASTMRANACAAWAFKKPDLMNLLPFLREAFPSLQVLHVVRDGRDMAFSHNHAPLRKYAPHLKALHVEGAANESEAMRQLSVWALQNSAVLAWGQRANHKLMMGQGHNAASKAVAAGGDDTGAEDPHAAVYRWVRIEDFGSSTSGAALLHPGGGGGTLFAAKVQALMRAAQHSSDGGRVWAVASSNTLFASKVQALMRAASSNARREGVGSGVVEPMGSHDDEEEEPPAAVPSVELIASVMASLQGASLGSFDPSVAAAAKKASPTSNDAKDTAAALIPGVSAQYGKWKTLASAEEQEALAARGKGALGAFGYLPPQDNTGHGGDGIGVAAVVVANLDLLKDFCTRPIPLPPKAAWPMLGGHSLAARRVALRISDSGRWWQTPRLQLGDRPMPPKTAAASW
eukprot:CAMPEP_0171834152 /NCGR_PEP_ID=MMETSP0992-20121227/10266_1 /TAXON_ID=483369 /ORGANISM="non described non described, Strain CCMP2098" /LENGTH=645 /DNA_ID=CAMNT_0012449827 /DNA_START=163 /DNA_END=2099 /DNA_ORIENTATION=+